MLFIDAPIDNIPRLQVITMIVAIIAFIVIVILVYKFGAGVSDVLFQRFSSSPSIAFNISNQRSIPEEKLSNEELHNIQGIFFNIIFTLLGYIAKVDGHINEVEIKLTETYMEKNGF